jgi:hypothetical protein
MKEIIYILIFFLLTRFAHGQFDTSGKKSPKIPHLTKDLLHEDRIFASLTYPKKDSTCTIYPSVGINRIIVLRTQFDSILKMYGPNKTKKEVVKGCGQSGKKTCGTKYYIEYKSQGIKFESDYFTKDKVAVIKLTVPCICKTEKGISIGNVKKDIFSSYGKPEFQQQLENGWLFKYAGITFYVDNSLDEKITEIHVYWEAPETNK